MADHVSAAAQSRILDRRLGYLLATGPEMTYTSVTAIGLRTREAWPSPFGILRTMAIAIRHAGLPEGANAPSPVPLALPPVSTPSSPRTPQPPAGNGTASATAGPGLDRTAGNGMLKYENVIAKGNALQFNSPIGTDPAILNCNMTHKGSCASEWSIMFNGPVLANPDKIVEVDRKYSERRNAAAAAPGQN